ncbi:MAG: Rpn family recombination-promoting nuclease/putative transposase, partial [Spirochaetia bacterium]|nr:Rpn family recombination-promoting nuclease/putative transposase [Spirochaetia bacterium]
MTVNRKYKDSVFRMLFNDKEKLRQLYNAIEGTDYDKNTPIKINTLSDSVFVTRHNDISFTIDDEYIVLIEHQSTVNGNIPVRMLIYLSLLYENIIDKDVLYKEDTSDLLCPRLIVLYNGKAEIPDVSYL